MVQFIAELILFFALLQKKTLKASLTDIYPPALQKTKRIHNSWR